MQGIPVELSAQVCWACISVMLLRAGLLVKLRAFRARKLAMLRLGVLPCLTTGSTYAGVMVSREYWQVYFAVIAWECVAGTCAHFWHFCQSAGQLGLFKLETSHAEYCPDALLSDD